MSETELIKDEIKMLFQANELALLEELNNDTPDPLYKGEIIEKGIELEKEKLDYDEKNKILENEAYKRQHDEIMNRIKTDFQQVDLLTQDKMYKEAREYNKKYNEWKKTARTMEELDTELVISKKMRERIELFLENVDDEITGQTLDISGDSFLSKKDQDIELKAREISDKRIGEIQKKKEELEKEKGLLKEEKEGYSRELEKIKQNLKEDKLSLKNCNEAKDKLELLKSKLEEDKDELEEDKDKFLKEIDDLYYKIRQLESKNLLQELELEEYDLEAYEGKYDDKLNNIREAEIKRKAEKAIEDIEKEKEKEEEEKFFKEIDKIKKQQEEKFFKEIDKIKKQQEEIDKIKKQQEQAELLKRQLESYAKNQ